MIRRLTYSFSLACLSALILPLSALVELTFALLEVLGIYRRPELFEDLRARQQSHSMMGICVYLTLSPE